INGGSGGSTYNATLNGTAAIVSGGIGGNALSLPSSTAVLTPNTAIPVLVGGSAHLSTESAWFDNLNASALTRYLFGSASGDSEALLTSGSGYTLGDQATGAHSTGINLSAYATGWHQLTVVQNEVAFNTTFYLDGQPIATIANSFSYNSFNAFGNIVSGGQPFAQQIDDVYVYNNQALTAAQVQQLYDSVLNGSLPSSTAVQISSGATLDLSGNNQQIGSLSGVAGSNVLLESGSLTVGSNNTPTTFSGVISGTGSLAKTGNATLTLAGPNTYSGGTTISGGTLIASNISAIGSGAVTVNAGAKLQFANTFHGTLVVPSFTVQSSGTADLGKTDLVINYNSSNPYAATLASIKSAYDLGKWDGTGIRSSALGTGMSLGIYDNRINTQSALDGISADSTEILIKYTWLGDANCDGVVNTADFSAISATGTTWQTGDFNYDGKVNADDYSLFMLGAAESGGANISTTLPEPSALLTFACGTLLADAMRKRRRESSQ
ncbi:MAG TPA: autotransporter-associated beta strand repeat-containing protein, partial [Tepidisphaeraceae bacterium]